MHILQGEDQREAKALMEHAAHVARNSSCLRSKCGTIILKDGEIIGSGFNSPPNNVCLQDCKKDSLPASFKSDKTCCLHAEQRAIMDALRNNPIKILDSRLFFIRLDENGEITKAGEPYCTICSKMALDSGIAEFVLWHEQGITMYDTKEYNELSFQYGQVPKS
jgi:deoxycytidylate deaminase